MSWKTAALSITAMVLWVGWAWAGGYEPGTKPRPFTSMGCPAVIYGKWKPYSRHTIDILGYIEIGKDWIDFSVHGRIPYRSHMDGGRREYFEFLAPLKEGSYAARSGKFFRPYFPPEWQDNAHSRCLLAFKICASEKDMLKSLAGSGDVYCETATFSPIIDDFDGR